jgi:hypothetical protein
VAWSNFSKFKNKNFQFKFQEQKNSNFLISKNFPCGINDLFLGPRLPNLLKIAKITCLSLPKIAIYYIPLLGGMVYRKRAQLAMGH